MKTTITPKRRQQLIDLEEIIRTAGSLNHGSHIMDKIQRLEKLCATMESNLDSENPDDMASLTSWLDRRLL